MIVGLIVLSDLIFKEFSRDISACNCWVQGENWDIWKVNFVSSQQGQE